MDLTLMEIKTLHDQLDLVKDVDCEFDFSYAVAKNKRELKSYIKHLEEKFKIPDDFKAYEEERLKMAYDMSLRDENDQPVIVNNSYVIKPDLRTEFKSKLEDLKEKYKEAIEKQKEISEKLEITLNEVKSVNIHMIKKSVVPKLTPAQMESVILFIEL